MKFPLSSLSIIIIKFYLALIRLYLFFTNINAALTKTNKEKEKYST